MKSLHIVPCNISEANAFVIQHHRHHGKVAGAKFALAVARDREDGADYEIVGVALIGRPVSRMLDDSWTLEALRIATDGTKNACSALYAAAWRTARAMGYRRLITYLLASETGGSVEAAGWQRVGETTGGSWSRTTRPRVDKHPTQGKIRYEVCA